MSEETWVRLKRGDDWGSVYYALEPLGPMGTANSRRGIKLRAGDRVRVRWPNGCVTEERIDFRPETRSVSDHGNSYNVSTNKIGVVVEATNDRSGRVVSEFIELTEVDIPAAWVEERSAGGTP